MSFRTIRTDDFQKGENSSLTELLKHTTLLSAYRILVVEDEPRVRETAAAVLGV
jgi:hypothetical protein